VHGASALNAFVTEVSVNRDSLWTDLPEHRTATVPILSLARQ
jgi:hypothetical protein